MTTKKKIATKPVVKKTVAKPVEKKITPKVVYPVDSSEGNAVREHEHF